MSKKSRSPKPTPSKVNTALDPDNLANGNNALFESVCGVCGEKTKSKHYGAYACLSCKAFFRRSIWDSQIYFCERNEGCIIKQGQRKGCKACRLAKCLKIGMNPKMLRSTHKRPAKQQEDLPSSEASLLHNPCVDRSQIDALVLFDRHLFNRVDPPTKPVGLKATAEFIELPFTTALRQPSLIHRRTEILQSIHRICDVTDILDDLRRKFVLYADWLNEFRDFQMLPEHVQAILAKAGLPKYNTNECAWRSFLIGCPGVSLGNGTLFPLDRKLQCAPDVKGTTSLFVYNIVDVLKSLKVDETEHILLKIISFFTEELLDLNEAESSLVREMRDKYIGILTSYVRSKHPRLVEQDAACRVGELMLLLASLTNLAHLANDTVEYWDTLRYVPIGNLMCETHKNPSGPPSSAALNSISS